jgi:2-oxoglutarate ferredoxin oxidoreductase subunit delta
MPNLAHDLPVLDESRCTCCGDCVPVCPKDCLEMKGGLPWLPRPMDCIACAACQIICPEQAIRMTPK